MAPDVVNLRQFYSSRLGRRVKLRLRALMVQHWPVLAQERVVGLGYATPLLTLLTRARSKPALIAALMPATQGAIYWPVHEANCTVLGDAMRPPFAVSSCSRMLMVHLLEHAAQPEELLRISWQLLSPGGKLLLFVPNRRGLWARFGATPFASGTRYTVPELKALLRAADFTLREASSALYAPPSTHAFWQHTAGLLEWVGRIFFPSLGGVLVLEAEKQIYAGVGNRVVKPSSLRAWQAQHGTAGVSAQDIHTD